MFCCRPETFQNGLRILSPHHRSINGQWLRRLRS